MKQVERPGRRRPVNRPRRDPEPGHYTTFHRNRQEARELLPPVSQAARSRREFLSGLVGCMRASAIPRGSFVGERGVGHLRRNTMPIPPAGAVGVTPETDSCAGARADDVDLPGSFNVEADRLIAAAGQME